MGDGKAGRKKKKLWRPVAIILCLRDFVRLKQRPWKENQSYLQAPHTGRKKSLSRTEQFAFQGASKDLRAGTYQENNNFIHHKLSSHVYLVLECTFLFSSPSFYSPKELSSTQYLKLSFLRLMTSNSYHGLSFSLCRRTPRKPAFPNLHFAPITEQM